MINEYGIYQVVFGERLECCGAADLEECREQIRGMFWGLAAPETFFVEHPREGVRRVIIYRR